MHRLRLALISLLVLALILGAVACGGGSAGLVDTELALADEVFIGIQNGDFKAVRYNDNGYRDSALNSSMDLAPVDSGDTTTVAIAINDTEPMYGVTLDLHYDPARYSPVEVNFGEMISEPVELAVTRISGLVALGQVDISGEAVRSGEFATVTFAHTPARDVSKVTAAAHSTLVDAAYTATQLTTQPDGFVALNDEITDAAPGTFKIWAIFATGDGDGNGESNISDLTPMVSYGYFGETVADDYFGPAAVDYDMNGEVNISDITPLGVHLGEATNGIEILLGDSATFAGTETVASTLNWTDGAAASPGGAITDWDDVFTTWTGAVTLADAEAADTNDDGFIYVSARSTDGTTPATACDGLEMHFQTFEEGFVITGFDFGIIREDLTEEDYNDGDTATLIAGEEITLNITGISGTYDPGTGAVAFTPADAGGTVPQTEYDNALADAITQAHWTATTNDLTDPTFWRTDTVLDPATSDGSGIAAVVFPDDDPESDATFPEGTLAVQMDATTGSFIPAAIPYAISLDVDENTGAPVINDLWTDFEQEDPPSEDWKVRETGNTVIQASFDFGDGGVPGDLSTVTAELFDFDSPLSPVMLTYTAENFNSGEFNIVDNPDPGVHPGDYIFGCLVGAQMIPDHHYMVRINSDEWTSVNKPGYGLHVEGVPTEVEFEIVPNYYGTPVDYMQVLYPDPHMRRDPRVTIDLIGGSVDPVDPAGYMDVIRDMGEEFPLTIIGTDVFPQITVIEGTDPSAIGATTAGISGVYVTERDPGKCVADIATITPPDPGSEKSYVFKLFGAAAVPADRPALGRGAFIVPEFMIDPGMPVGVDWGLNIFGRAATALGDRDFSDKNLNGSTVGGAQPDVFFVEFSGGTVHDYGGTSNVSVMFEDIDTAKQMSVDLNVRIAGLGGSEINMISVHTVVPDDFTNPGAPGWPGIFNPGATFDVSLDDPTEPGIDFTFPEADRMIVTGTNPNTT